MSRKKYYIGIANLILLAMTMPMLFQFSEKASHTSPRTLDKIAIFDPTDNFLADNTVIHRTSSCSDYMQYLENAFPRNTALNENTFPLAFAISVHHQAGILELFLASSFHPLDSYCIHVDVKATEKVKTAVAQLVKCYKWKYPDATIFIVDNPIPVFWGHFSVLEADLKCMNLLRTKNEQWKILVNPAATELPLKPMAEIRRQLKSSPNGIIGSVPVPDGNRDRFSHSYELQRKDGSLTDKKMVRTNTPKDLPPRNITIKKGLKNVALTREFVDFALDAPYPKELQSWLQDTSIPDEHYFSTIVTIFENTTNDSETKISHGGCLRLSWWLDDQCCGETIRQICNFGVGDLPRLHQNQFCLFANKFNLDVDPIAPIQHVLYLMDL